MNSAARKRRQQGRLRTIAKHVQVEHHLRAELEIVRTGRDTAREQIRDLWLVLVHEFGLTAGEGHEPACEAAVRLLREQRGRLAGLEGLMTGGDSWVPELRSDESEMPPDMLETGVS